MYIYYIGTYTLYKSLRIYYQIRTLYYCYIPIITIKYLMNLLFIYFNLSNFKYKLSSFKYLDVQLKLKFQTKH